MKIIITFFVITCSIGLIASPNDAFADPTFVSPPFDISDQETNPRDVTFNTDGTKMFVLGDLGIDVNEYACSTGFDVSTCSFTSPPFSLRGETVSPASFTFNTDGTKMFVLEAVAPLKIYEYACSTGFDVSTCSFTIEYGSVHQSGYVSGLAFSTDGKKMYVIGHNDDEITRYTLSTGFDLSSTVTLVVPAFSISNDVESTPYDVEFSTDGKKMYVIGGSSKSFLQ